MAPYRITTDYAEHSPDAEALHDAIDGYTMEGAKDHVFWPVTLCLRNSEGRLCGGLVGIVWAGWLEIKVLWLEKDLRRTGYGSKLLHEAERYAYSRGARHAHLCSFTFQAPGFYEKHGYRIFGELPDYPNGQTNVFMRKALVGET